MYIGHWLLTKQILVNTDQQLVENKMKSEAVGPREIRFYDGNTCDYFKQLEKSIIKAKQRLCVAGWRLDVAIVLNNFCFVNLLFEKAQKNPAMQIIIVVWSHELFLSLTVIFLFYYKSAIKL